jgi:hypothetical protein
VKNRAVKYAIVLVVTAAALYAAFEGLEYAGYVNSPLIEVYHCPKKISRRYGDFTANITGRLAPFTNDARYRFNGGDWIEVAHNRSRVPVPKFTIELPVNQLKPGINTVEIRGKRFGFEDETRVCEFEYDPSPVRLPIEEDWSDPDLDSQDGAWETILVDGTHRVRPVPGQEDYDRIVVVTGAFAGARRVETELVLRHHATNQPYGFGVLPLWGGRPDRDDVLPSRGWNFSLVWYYSWYKGIGQEFSYKESSALPEWVSNYQDYELEPDVLYRIVVECGPVVDDDGKHLRFFQRMKWWADGQPEPTIWMELTDVQGAPLPPGEFCVALVAHRSQVEFGPVRVLPLESGK